MNKFVRTDTGLRETSGPFLLYTLSMTPDAIIVLPAGIMPLEAGGWRSTTYEESDAFGTLGGRDRVEAAALLAKKYPNAYMVTTSHTLGRATPSLAEVYARELCELGVIRERIIEEESSNTTQAGLRAALQLAEKRGWGRLLFVSSGFHIPRIIAFFHREKSCISTEFISSESVLSTVDPAFAAQFAAVRKTAAYQARLASEARGLEALRAGFYHSASTEDKKER